MTKINSLLVANRGEIACRIIRTANSLGIRTIAVYSDADADSPHVRQADDAVHIGPSPVGESYLRADKILDAAKLSNADAIHPGYGFLSENAGFANAVAKAGLIFVGPSEKAINVMGDKARSKRAMIKAKVPCVPGYQGEDQSDGVLIKEAEKIGYPLMVKAAAGGGGRGMRLVDHAKQLPNAIKLARSEAENAFGSGELIIEKAIIRPRHVEIQVFGDTHGNIIHLGERDCSVQRRHQKVIEEAPCPVMTEQLRAEMGKAAIDAARAVEYVGAGTVEFLLAEDGSFYFLEMNTRLQVEHPVTEMVTGLDLVRLQLLAAEGAPLPVAQEDIALNGHAIEVRLYAEDPEADFLPSTGPVELFRQPNGKGIRIDTGIETGGNVSPYYDPMVAKIIAFGESREIARNRLLSGLKETALVGPKNNRDFLIDALSQERFAQGTATTAFISEVYGDSGFSSPPLSNVDLALAAVIQHTRQHQIARQLAPNINSELVNWGSSGQLRSVYVYDLEEMPTTVHVVSKGGGPYQVVVGDTEHSIIVREFNSSSANLRIDGRGIKLTHFSADEHTIHISTGTRTYSLMDLSSGRGEGQESAGGGIVTAPMHGRLTEIIVKKGQDVVRGDKLAVLEAMKMQHEILAEIDGKVIEILGIQGNQISADDIILEIEPVDTD